MKRIPLTRGKFALVDDEDFDWLNQWRWHYQSAGYAARNKSRKLEKKHYVVLMHREIMKCPDGLDVDHRDLDRLNCQKLNLRICSRGQNEANKHVQSNNKLGYKGVSLIKGKYFHARIYAHGRQHFLGAFPDVISAAKAYDIKAFEFWGEFARLNFPLKESKLAQTGQTRVPIEDKP